jgi:hypothetical protein
MLLAGLLLASACAPRKPVAPVPEKPGTAQLLEQAEQAWQGGQYGRAETLYRDLLRSGELNDRQTSLAWERFARSAARNRHYQAAEQGLKNWAELEPEVKRSWEWHDIYVTLLKRQGRAGSVQEHLGMVAASTAYPWQLRSKAAMRLAGFLLRRGEHKEAWTPLEKLYAQAETDERKEGLETRLERMLDQMGRQRLNRVWDAFSPPDIQTYPYALVEWHRALKRFEQGRMDWQEAWQILNTVAREGELVRREPLLEKIASLEEKNGRPPLGVALLLPMTGGYGRIGWKVARGADAAHWRLVRDGTDITVRVINTQAGNWQEKLRELPPNFILVGGPLRGSVWKKIMQERLFEKRVFFTFRSAIDPGEEGRHGYRFFPGSRDQVRPLVKVLRQELDIRNFGILYPKSSFGRRMARAFWLEVEARGGDVTALEGYDEGMQVGWRKTVAEFLQVPEDWSKEGEPQVQNATLAGSNATNATNATNWRPDPDYKAVFLPDSFNRAQILVPEFFFFDEDRLLFLGPMLWSQEISRISALDRQYYRLALMTGAWWPKAGGEASRELEQALSQTVQGEPDFWTGLGFDFVRFASKLPLRYSKWAPERINAYLSRFSGMSWSVAPLSWDRQGRASQELFMFRPGSNGLLPVDGDRLKKRREQIVERHKAREKQRRRKAREELRKKMQEKPPAGEDVHNATAGAAGGDE